MQSLHKQENSTKNIGIIDQSRFINITLQSYIWIAWINTKLWEKII